MATKKQEVKKEEVKETTKKKVKLFGDPFVTVEE